MRCILTALALTVASSAQAQVFTCNPDGVQAEVNRCADDDFDKADAELNAVYRQALASLAKHGIPREPLKAAQRLWIQLRDADLHSPFPAAKGENDVWSKYGTMYPMMYTGTKTELTRQRTAYLRRQFLEHSPIQPNDQD